MAIDGNRAARIRQEQTSGEETPMPKRKKPGPKTLVPGEPTERVMTNVPRSTLTKMQRRIGRRGTLAGYIRDLIEADLKRAS
jgi:hypothetical protein